MTSPLPEQDSSRVSLSKHEKKNSPLPDPEAESLEDSHAMDDRNSEEPSPGPESSQDRKVSNGGTKHLRSPSPLPLPSKTKPASRTNSKPYIFPGARRPAMTRDELKQCSSVIRALKRHPDSGPFLQPVDIKRLKIPDYPNIIKKPMDLDTAEKKLGVCAYEVVDEFFADIQRIFDNCYLYNGYDAPVSCFAKRLQAKFEELKANFSRVSEILEQEAALPSAQKGYGGSRAKPRSKQASRKTSQAHIHSAESPAGRYSPMAARFGGEMPEHHKKFCNGVLKELFKKLHLSYSAPFLEPVDWEVLNLPDYPHIVKNPMDLSTVKKKFQSGKYTSALEFENDIRLIFQNCFKYNPPSGQVHQMGMKLKGVFESKWSQRPSDMNAPNDGLSSGSSDASPPKPSQQVPRKLANSPRVEPKQETRGRKRKGSSLSQDTTRPPTKVPKPKGRVRKNQGITYAQKKELSEAINRLSGAMLNVVVDLIHRSMPELGSSQNEIEVDIDALDNTTLSKLYSYVMSDPSTKVKQDVEPRRPREDTGSKVPRHADYPQDLPKKRPTLSSSSSSTSSGSDSDSGSSALQKSSKTSRPPKSNLSAKKSSQRAKLPSSKSTDGPSKPRENVEAIQRSSKRRENVDPQRPAKPSDPPQRVRKPREDIEATQRSAKGSDSIQRVSKLREVVEPSVRARRLSAVADAAAKSRPRPRLISPPPKAPSPIAEESNDQANLPKVGSRPLTTDVSWANIQANLRGERERLEAKKNRTAHGSQQPVVRRERKQREEDTRSLAQRNEEEARRIIQLKRSREEAAFAMAQEDKRVRLAIGANRKDLLYQNRLMRRYEDKMTREIRLEQEQARKASMSKPPTSSVSPPPPTNGQQRHQLEDGEIEEGELFE
ncbi:hypothetical protein DSO57_1026250 [Entomophthora muscae]|uniref:Uncharacterized protein n=1 Tax=Entomophthora muscae TaxID=34485 RepID=A0ACC2ULX8_9FUNG|nr:hypothetical protein DSO57_1026250 [Entomophthora muscae]